MEVAEGESWYMYSSMRKKQADADDEIVDRLSIDPVPHAEEDENEESEMTLPGFRFHPTDEELVGFYLRRKVEGKPLRIELIKQVDIYKYEPWELPKASGSVGDKEWYFFCVRGRKYRNSIRPNRVTGSGFWKATGIDRPIYSNGTNADTANSLCIGLKKSLVYYRGSAGKGTKTDWMMHEFRLPSKSVAGTNQEAEMWTLCRIFKRNVSQRKYLQMLCEGNSSATDIGDRQCLQQQVPPVSDSSSKSSSTVESSIDSRGYRKKTKNHQFDGTTAAKAAPSLSYMSMYDTFHNQRSPLTAGPSPGIDTFRDVNWDELGQVMGFTTDQALVYGCAI